MWAFPRSEEQGPSGHTDRRLEKFGITHLRIKGPVLEAESVMERQCSHFGILPWLDSGRLVGRCFFRDLEVSLG